MSIAQPLCQAGICNSDPQNNTAHVKKTFTNYFSTAKSPTLKHSFVSGGLSTPNVIGSDRFRFIKSFWTSSDVSTLQGALSQVGNNPCPLPGTAFGVTQLPASLSGQTTSPFNIEVDKDEGYATLAVILQYQGVAPLAGITAGLKLPSGFAAQLPLTDDPNNYGIALSNFYKTIGPGDSVTLCFPLNVLHSAVVNLPVLGPLALHFLRVNQRTISDTMDTQQIESFMHQLQVSKGQNMTTFANSFNNNLMKTAPIGPDNSGNGVEYYSEFDRLIPFNYINQVIPVIWKVTGREILDVSLPTPYIQNGGVVMQPPIAPFPPSVPPGGGYNAGVNQTVFNNIFPPHTQSKKASNHPSPGAAAPGDSPGKPGVIHKSSTPGHAVAQGNVNYTRYTNPVNIIFNNYGDVALHNLVAIITTNVSSLVTGAATAQVYPLGVQGQATFHILTIPAFSNRTITAWITTAIGCAGIEPITVSSTYTNAIGERIAQTNTVTLQIQQATTLANQTCAVPSSSVVPGLVEPQQAIISHTIQ
jgi:hypothetical protein